MCSLVLGSSLSRCPSRRTRIIFAQWISRRLLLHVRPSQSSAIMLLMLLFMRIFPSCSFPVGLLASCVGRILLSSASLPSWTHSRISILVFLIPGYICILRIPRSSYSYRTSIAAVAPWHRSLSIFGKARISVACGRRPLLGGSLWDPSWGCSIRAFIIALVVVIVLNVIRCDVIWGEATTAGFLLLTGFCFPYTSFFYCHKEVSQDRLQYHITISVTVFLLPSSRSTVPSRTFLMLSMLCEEAAKCICKVRNFLVAE